MMQALSRTLARTVTYYRSRLPRGSFAHHVWVMFVATGLGQAASVLLSPILTRLYAPETFGVLGAFTAILNIVAVMTSLCYERALPLERTQEGAANLLMICVVSLLLTTAIGMFLVLVVLYFALAGTPLAVLTPYRLLLPVGFLGIGAYQVMVQYATQHEAYRVIAGTKLTQGLAGPLTQIVLGLAGTGAWGLVIGYIVGQSTGSGLLWARLIGRRLEVFRGVSWQAMRAVARHYAGFPFWLSWSSLINAAGGIALVLVVMPLLYTPAIAGYIFLIDRILGRPLMMVSTSMLQPYLGDIAKSLTTNPLAVRGRFLRVAAFQLMIVTGWLLPVNVAAPFLFPRLFGDAWGAAVPYLHVLSITYLPQMVLHALTHTLQVLERQRTSAAWDAGRLCAVLGALLIGHACGLDTLHVLLLYSVTQALAQLVHFYLMYRAIQCVHRAASQASARRA